MTPSKARSRAQSGDLATLRRVLRPSSDDGGPSLPANNNTSWTIDPFSESFSLGSVHGGFRQKHKRVLYCLNTTTYSAAQNTQLQRKNIHTGSRLKTPAKPLPSHPLAAHPLVGPITRETTQTRRGLARQLSQRGELMKLPSSVERRLRYKTKDWLRPRTYVTKHHTVTHQRHETYHKATETGRPRTRPPLADRGSSRQHPPVG